MHGGQCRLLSVLFYFQKYKQKNRKKKAKTLSERVKCVQHFINERNGSNFIVLTFKFNMLQLTVQFANGDGGVCDCMFKALIRKHRRRIVGYLSCVSSLSTCIIQSTLNV